jgi:hypothetical protein
MKEICILKVGDSAERFHCLWNDKAG